MTKLRCPYQFKSPMESVHRFVAIKLWTLTCLFHGLLFSPCQYCSMLREPMRISSSVRTSAPAKMGQVRLFQSPFSWESSQVLGSRLRRLVGHSFGA